jgi:hypothetical protein
MSNSESILQITVVSMIRALYPSLLMNLSLNGVSLPGTPKQISQIISQAKREGLEPGIPDLLVYLPGGRVLNWEFKRPKGGVQSAEQLAIEHKLKSLDHHYELIRSSNQAFASIADNTTQAFCQSEFDLVVSNLVNPIKSQFLHWPTGTDLSIITAELKSSLYHI